MPLPPVRVRSVGAPRASLVSHSLSRDGSVHRGLPQLRRPAQAPPITQDVGPLSGTHRILLGPRIELWVLNTVETEETILTVCQAIHHLSSIDLSSIYYLSIIYPSSIIYHLSVICRLSIIYHLSTHPSSHPFIYLSIHPSVQTCIHRYTRTFTCL